MVHDVSGGSESHTHHASLDDTVACGVDGIREPETACLRSLAQSRSRHRDIGREFATSDSSPKHTDICSSSRSSDQTNRMTSYDGRSRGDRAARPCSCEVLVSTRRPAQWRAGTSPFAIRCRPWSSETIGQECEGNGLPGAVKGNWQTPLPLTSSSGISEPRCRKTSVSAGRSLRLARIQKDVDSGSINIVDVAVSEFSPDVVSESHSHNDAARTLDVFREESGLGIPAAEVCGDHAPAGKRLGAHWVRVAKCSPHERVLAVGTLLEHRR